MNTSKKLLVLSALLIASQAFVGLSAAGRVLRSGKVVNTLDDRRAGYKPGLNADAAKAGRIATSNDLRSASKAAQQAAKRQAAPAAQAPAAVAAQAAPVVVQAPVAPVMPVAAPVVAPAPAVADPLAGAHPSTKAAYARLLAELATKKITKEAARKRVDAWKTAKAVKDNAHNEIEKAFAEGLAQMGVKQADVQQVPAAEQAKVAQALNSGLGVVVNQVHVEIKPSRTIATQTDDLAPEADKAPVATPSFFARHKTAITVSLIAVGGAVFVVWATGSTSTIVGYLNNYVVTPVMALLTPTTATVAPVADATSTICDTLCACPPLSAESTALKAAEVALNGTQVALRATQDAVVAQGYQIGNLTQVVTEGFAKATPSCAPVTERIIERVVTVTATATPVPTATVIATMTPTCVTATGRTWGWYNIGAWAAYAISKARGI